MDLDLTAPVKHAQAALLQVYANANIYIMFVDIDIKGFLWIIVISTGKPSKTNVVYWVSETKNFDFH